MTNIVILQMPFFKKVYKKLSSKEKSHVDNAIQAIIEDSTIGEAKKGDLNGVLVYKFKIHQQQMLLAYEVFPRKILLLALGTHENFDRDLKKNLNATSLTLEI